MRSRPPSPEVHQTRALQARPLLLASPNYSNRRDAFRSQVRRTFYTRAGRRIGGLGQTDFCEISTSFCLFARIAGEWSRQTYMIFKVIFSFP